LAAVIVDLFFGGAACGMSSRERRALQLALTLAEREVISRGVTAHRSARSIARLLGRSPSREPGMTAMAAMIARAALADRMPGRGFVVQNACKWRTVRGYGRQGRKSSDWSWSPEQIAGWLKRTHPEDGVIQVSHETIYAVYCTSRGVLKKVLLSHL